MFRPIIFSGICRCGHSWEDHHLGVIVNTEVLKELAEKYPKHPYYIPQECEFFGCNEEGGFDNNGNEHCLNYVDKDFYKE